MGQISALQIRKDAQDDRDPRLVVRPEDGLAVAVDHAVAQNRYHPFRGTYGVHMGAEHYGRSGGIARYTNHDVSRVAARPGGRIVHHHG